MNVLPIVAQADSGLVRYLAMGVMVIVGIYLVFEGILAMFEQHAKAVRGAVVLRIFGATNFYGSVAAMIGVTQLLAGAALIVCVPLVAIVSEYFERRPLGSGVASVEPAADPASAGPGSAGASSESAPRQSNQRTPSQPVSAPPASPNSGRQPSGNSAAASQPASGRRAQNQNRPGNLPRGFPRGGPPFRGGARGPSGSRFGPGGIPIPRGGPRGGNFPRQVQGRFSELIGGPGGGPFRNTSNQPLLGFRFKSRRWMNQDALWQLDPIYAHHPGNQAFPGVQARDGYAVGAIDIDADRLVNAVRLVFMRIKDREGLDPDDSYLSPWIGDPSGREPERIDGQGTPITGVHGRRSAVIESFGVIFQR